MAYRFLSVLAVPMSKSGRGTNNRWPWIFLSFSWGPTNNSVLSLSSYPGN